MKAMMTDSEIIRILYERLLEREPDVNGLSYHLELLRETGDMRCLIESFINSTEYKARQNDISPLITILKRNNAYLARKEISILHESYSKDDKRLESYGFKVYSQADEDGIIDEIFKRLNIERGIFCEIGVQNGMECNSLFLLHKGWHGTWIEGDIQQRDFIQTKFSSILDKRLKTCFSFITKENINEIITSLNLHKIELDFFSIDIDGNDIYILETIHIKPKVICIEYNSKYPGNIRKKQSYNPTHVWSGTDYFGASLREITDVAMRKGYSLVGTNIVGTNAFFVRSDLIGKLFSSIRTAEYLYNPPRYWLIEDHFSNIGHPADFGSYGDFDEPA